MFEELIYRRQYLITNQTLSVFPHWKCCTFLTGELNVYLHPDLEFTYIERPGVELMLLGFILDAHNPAFGNQEILDVLVKEKDFHAFLKATFKYCGRYILIHKTADSIQVVQDTFAFREVFYYQNKEAFYLASQTTLLQEFVTLPTRTDTEVLKFMENPIFQHRKTFIGEETVFEGVRHLMPNHYLDLTKGQIVRYYPLEPIGDLSLEEGVEILCHYLQGFAKSVANRYEFIVPFTAGWDSRMMIAAMREVRDKAYFFINKYPNYNQKTPDIYIPAQLAKKLKIDFHIHEIDAHSHPIDVQFKAIYEQNYSLPKMRNLPAHYYLFRHHSNKMMVMTTGSEVIRNYYLELQLTGKTFAQHVKYPNVAYVKKQGEKWIAEVLPLAQKAGLRPLDMFYFEHLGNWGARNNTQGDMYRETVSLYNCRDLMNQLLAVDIRYREKDNVILYTKAMQKMWKEILSAPINPFDTNLGAKKYMLHLLKKVNLYDPIKKIYFEWNLRKKVNFKK